MAFICYLLLYWVAIIRCSLARIWSKLNSLSLILTLSLSLFLFSFSLHFISLSLHSSASPFLYTRCLFFFSIPHISHIFQSQIGIELHHVVSTTRLFHPDEDCQKKIFNVTAVDANTTWKDAGKVKFKALHSHANCHHKSILPNFYLRKMDFFHFFVIKLGRFIEIEKFCMSQIEKA